MPLTRFVALTALMFALVIGAAGAATNAHPSHRGGWGPGTGRSGPGGRPGRLAQAPRQLTTEDLTAPMNVNNLTPPDFGWQLAAGYQAAYQLQVADSPRQLALGRDIWDSGRVHSTHNHNAAYGGPALSASSDYYWRVRTWGTGGHRSRWSRPASFGTGPGAAWPHATPIWASSADSGWTNYTISGTFAIVNQNATITFRRQDDNNYYMWQFEGNGVNTVNPQIDVNGTYSNLKAGEKLPFTLTDGTKYDFKIVVQGSTFTTYLKPDSSSSWDQIDQTTDNTFSNGGIGFRTGHSERTDFYDLNVTDPSGNVLYQSNFSGSAANAFSCGTIENGYLYIGVLTSCGIGYQDDDWAFMRGDVALVPHRTVAWAHLYATAASTSPTHQFVYKLWVNGQFVGVGPTSPYGSETEYNSYDVTRLLHTHGNNAIAVQAYTTADHQFDAELVVRYTNGTTRTFGTGPGWKAINGSDILPDDGSVGTSSYTLPKEDYDAANFPFGFTEAGFDDSAWPAATGKAELTDLQATPTANVQERLERPVSVDEYAPGDYIVDYGRTWLGGMSLNLDGSAGQVVDIRYGEVMNGADSVEYQTNAGNDWEDKWTLTAGRQHLQTWGMRVFRYVQITGAPTGLTKADFTADAYVYPYTAPADEFNSSSPNLNKVWALSRNTIEDVNGDLYVDSWERERHVYEADSYLQLMSNLYLDGDPTLGAYSLQYLMTNRTWPTEWPLYVILAMHELYETTGSTTQLSEDYAALQAKLPNQWLDSSSGLIYKTTGDTGGTCATDCDIVDWPASERDGYVFTPYNTVINAISYRAYADMADIAKALGKSTDAATYAADASAIKAAVNKYMWDPTEGAYRDGLYSLTDPVDHYAIQASVFATAFGLADRSQTESVAGFIDKQGMACSVYCAAFLLQALYDGDASTTATNMMTSTANGANTDSWMGMILQGAGATMEAWNPALKSNLSYSHPWASSPAFDIPQGMFGIEPTSPGYRTFTVKPEPGNVSWASVRVPTQNGSIAVAYRTAGRRITVSVAVPANTTATVSIPTTSRTATTVYMDGRRVRATNENGFLKVANVTAGFHVFSTAPGRPGRGRPTARTAS